VHTRRRRLPWAERRVYNIIINTLDIECGGGGGDFIGIWGRRRVSVVYKKYIYLMHSSAVHTTYVIKSVWSDNKKTTSKLQSYWNLHYNIRVHLYYSHYNIVYYTRTNERCGFAGIDYRVAQQQRVVVQCIIL